MKLHEKTGNKYIGCLTGAAIGDALGKQNEGLKRSDIRKKGIITDYGIAPEGCPGEHLRPGQYTDDTEQMIVLAESILASGGFEIGDFARKIALWGIDTMNDPLRRSLIGPSSSVSIKRLNSGMSWRDSGSDIPSCGSAMRVAPIGLFYKDLDKVEEMACLSSIPTHNNKEAIAGAVAVAVGVRCALLDMECSEIIKEVTSRASKYHKGLARKLALSFDLKDTEPGDAFMKLGTSYLASETVPSAFYCFSRHFNDPQMTVIEAVNAGGDADSIACISGALCGAFHGFEKFPGKWLDGLENKDNIMALAEMIFKRTVW